MLKMSQVNYIRDLYNSGCRISEITCETGIDLKTIRKYISKDDFQRNHRLKQLSNLFWMNISRR